MKKTLTRKLTEKEKDLIGLLLVFLGCLFVVLGLRSPVGGGDSAWTYSGMFTVMAALGMLTGRDREED